MTEGHTGRLNAALEGRYRIERELGEGGMATVYLADDLKHERKVALKVLKPELAAVVGAERFLAEIKTTANLQHPHILPLFDSGEADSFLFYVMPYVEGETLRDRLEREKQLPVDEAVRIATDVAEALQAAHEQGVIHRDIKPANILLSKGRPLVADFGIALAVSAAGGGRLTETGLSMGTPYYMSPEQASADRDPSAASDVYSLGCVLYEMLVGEPPYSGGGAQAVLAKILTEDARAPTQARPSIPANVDAAIRKALEKLPADRFRGAQDFARALIDPAFRYGEPERAGASDTTWKRLSFGTAALALVATFVAAWSLARPVPDKPVAWIQSPFDDREAPSGGMELISDGSGVVYVGPGAAAGETQLWIRRWSDLNATPLDGTEGASGHLRISPEGTEVAFATRSSFGDGPLLAVSLEGGQSRTLATTATFVSDWTRDGWIYFLDESPPWEIRRVRDTGGASETVLESEGNTAPVLVAVLPGGETLVYHATDVASDSISEIWALDVESGSRTLLEVGNSPRFVAQTGHLMFGTVSGELMSVPVDPATGEFQGTPREVAGGLRIDLTYEAMDYSVSATGDLIYRSGLAGRESDRLFEFVWVDRSGQAIPAAPNFTFAPGGESNAGWQLSPDDGRVVFGGVEDGNRDIWVKDLPGGRKQRITFAGTDELAPRWSPDGQSVTYVGAEEGLYATRVDGTGDAELLYDEETVALGFWSPDMEWLILRQSADLERGLGARNIVALRAASDGQVTPLVADDEDTEQGPALSPDGRWLAYSSNENGREEAYVAPFPDVAAGKWQVSSDGAIKPLWAHNGRELFFVSPQRREIFVVPFEIRESEGQEQAVFSPGAPQLLFALPPDYLYAQNSDFYDVSLDDQRFLMARPFEPDGARRSVVLIQNFFEELKRLVPN